MSRGPRDKVEMVVHNSGPREVIGMVSAHSRLKAR